MPHPLPVLRKKQFPMSLPTSHLWQPLIPAKNRESRLSLWAFQEATQEKDAFNSDYFRVGVYKIDPTNGFAAKKYWTLKK